MNETEFMQITTGIIQSARKYPNCPIANCKCNSKNGERIGKCYCLCHVDEIVAESRRQKEGKQV